MKHKENAYLNAAPDDSRWRVAKAAILRQLMNRARLT